MFEIAKIKNIPKIQQDERYIKCGISDNSIYWNLPR